MVPERDKNEIVYNELAMKDIEDLRASKRHAPPEKRTRKCCEK